jgi:hypothetical protein
MLKLYQTIINKMRAISMLKSKIFRMRGLFFWGMFLAVGVCSFGATAKAEVTFYDDFESQRMDAATTKALPINLNGFTWSSNNRTSVVRDEWDFDPSGGRVVWSSGVVNTFVAGRDWRTRIGGGHHLRFRYPAGQEWTEQRFSLGTHYNDIWIAYWIRVPINYTHGSANNKFLALWVGSKGYDTYGSVIWNTRPDGKGGANLVYQDGGSLRGENGRTLFISVPADRGRWMQVVIHVQSASGPDAQDGVIQLYRRWAGETSWTTIHNYQSADTWNGGSQTQGISHGYLMGWANHPYDVDTEWLIDDFKISTTNLLDENQPDPNPIPGDINKDGVVNIFDYNIFLQNFGATNDCQNVADLNGDCSVNIFDYNILLQNFGRTQ